MKTAFLVLSFLILVAVNASMACSVYVDHNAQKKILATQAISYLDVSPASVTSTTVSGYTKYLTDVDPVSQCPTTLDTHARVKFVYNPSPKEDCQAEVTVSRSVYIGEDASISFENVEFTDPEAICSMRPTRPVRPVRRLPTGRPARPVRP